MARNEANEKIRPIEITDNETGDKYILEFSRDSVIFTNRQGFKAGEFGDNMMEMLPILFYGAFRMHHKNVSRQKTDKILFEDLKGISNEVMERLLMLYNEPHNSLLHNNGEDEKNGRMTIVL